MAVMWRVRLVASLLEFPGDTIEHAVNWILCEDQNIEQVFLHPSPGLFPVGLSGALEVFSSRNQEKIQDNALHGKIRVAIRSKQAAEVCF